MKKYFLTACAVIIAALLVASPQLAGAASEQDDALAKAVSEKLMSDSSFNATNIIVTAEDGVVLLRGDINGENSKDDQKAMERSAMGVPGVKRVKTEITLSTPGS